MYIYIYVYVYMAVSRLFIYTKEEGVHRAKITERTLSSDGVWLLAAEQSRFGTSASQ